MSVWHFAVYRAIGTATPKSAVYRTVTLVTALNMVIIGVTWSWIGDLYTGESISFPDNFCQGEFSNHLPECSIKSFTLSLQTPWTSFDPYLYSGGSSFCRPLLWWKIATVRSFILNRGIKTDIMPATPPDPGWCAVHSTPSRLLSARSVPCRQAYRPVGIDCKGTGQKGISHCSP